MGRLLSLVLIDNLRTVEILIRIIVVEILGRTVKVLERPHQQAVIALNEIIRLLLVIVVHCQVCVFISLRVLSPNGVQVFERRRLSQRRLPFLKVCGLLVRLVKRIYHWR